MSPRPKTRLPAARSTSRALTMALLRTREHVMEPIRPVLATIGVSEQKWRVLRVLAEFGALEQTAIAREACLLLPSLTRILRAMELEGLVERQTDSVDRRRSIVKITRKAQSLVDEHLPTSSAVYGDLKVKLGPEKLEQLLDLLEEVQAIDL